MTAAFNALTNVVEALMKFPGILHNEKNKDGDTPRDLANDQYHEEVVEWLDNYNKI